MNSKTKKNDKVFLLLPIITFLIFLGSTFLFFTKAVVWDANNALGFIYIKSGVETPTIFQLMFGYGSNSILGSSWPRMIALTFCFAIHMLLVTISTIMLILYFARKIRINIVGYSMAFLSLLAIFNGTMPLCIPQLGDGLSALTVMETKFSQYANLANGPIIYCALMLFCVILGFLNFIFISIKKEK